MTTGERLEASEDLWAAYRAEPTEALRHQLVLQYSPLVKYVAGRVRVHLPATVESADLVSEGVIGATAQQNPVRMAEQAVDAVATFLSTGEEPVPDTGIDMLDTGVVLVTDDPQPGVPSIDVAEGMKRCWGKAA